MAIGDEWASNSDLPGARPTRAYRCPGCGRVKMSRNVGPRCKGSAGDPHAARTMNLIEGPSPPLRSSPDIVTE